LGKDISVGGLGGSKTPKGPMTEEERGLEELPSPNRESCSAKKIKRERIETRGVDASPGGCQVGERENQLIEKKGVQKRMGKVLL